MRIRFYKKIDGYRWIGFFLAMISVLILSNADQETQWIGWGLSFFSCGIWIIIAWKDKDPARTLMEVMYLALSARAVINWF
jgi:hypothetical protein